MEIRMLCENVSKALQKSRYIVWSSLVSSCSYSNPQILSTNLCRKGVNWNYCSILAPEDRQCGGNLMSQIFPRYRAHVTLVSTWTPAKIIMWNFKSHLCLAFINTNLIYYVRYCLCIIICKCWHNTDGSCERHSVYLKQELRADHYIKEILSSQDPFPRIPDVIGTDLLPSLNIWITREANSIKQT